MSNKEQKQNGIINLSSSDSGVLYSFAVLTVLLVTIIFSTVMVSVAVTNPKVMESDAVIILNYLSGPIAVILAIGILRLKRKAEIFSALDIKSFDKISVISTILIFLGLTFGLSEVNAIFVSWLEKLGLTVSAPTLPEKTIGGIIASVVCVCIIPAVIEETLFRGLILSGLKKSGTMFAVIFSGVIFALFHMNPAQTVYQFIVGSVYALIILYGKNLILTVSMHFINNLYIVLNYYFWNFSFSGAAQIIVTVIGILCLIGGAMLLILKGNKLSTQGEDIKGERAKFIFGALFGIVATAITWIVTLVA
ncbi:MAG: CPBP family intramembrane metalloprotease [Clostridia bacterium]|nr:CPBP family intramembrane metalloprotease [Clostridia bacterium]